MSLEVTYKNNQIGELTQDGTLTLETAGKWLEDDIGLSYTGGGGSGTVSSDDVQFIDYDGTVVYSYSKEDFLALTSMPANPTHEGLTAQGWNWTLSDAKDYVTEYGMIDIGQLYVTDDGKTRLYLSFPEGTPSSKLTINLHYNQTAANGVSVDWGDNTAVTSVGGTGHVSQSHTFATWGNYMVKMTVNSGSATLETTSTTSNSINIFGNAQFRYLIKVELGNNIGTTYYTFVGCRLLETITANNNLYFARQSFDGCYSLRSLTASKHGYAPWACRNCYSLINVSLPKISNAIGDGFIFQYCYSLKRVCCPQGTTNHNLGVVDFISCTSLEKITMRNGTPSIGYQAFQGCSSIKEIKIPESVSEIQNNVFQNCYSLSKINIPDKVTSIANSTFQNCYSLPEITLPFKIASIGTNAFNSCSILMKLHFKSATPPTVSNSNAWTSLCADCVISVPTGALTAYTTATNYPSSSTYTYVEDSTIRVFDVDTDRLLADVGMTWGEWVNSDYNESDLFEVSGNNIIVGSDYVHDANNNLVLTTDVITTQVYTLS